MLTGVWISSDCITAWGFRSRKSDKGRELWLHRSALGLRAT